MENENWNIKISKNTKVESKYVFLTNLDNQPKTMMLRVLCRQGGISGLFQKLEFQMREGRKIMRTIHMRDWIRCPLVDFHCHMWDSLRLYKNSMVKVVFMSL